MGTPKHWLSQIDPENRTAVCFTCGPTKIKPRSPAQAPGWRCRGPHNEARNRRNRATSYQRRKPYRAHVRELCSRCGFVPEHPCQLDVDHIDGDHQNNDPDNLQTLCANCHRLKTWSESH